jgi:hypothetical protein
MRDPKGGAGRVAVPWSWHREPRASTAHGPTGRGHPIRTISPMLIRLDERASCATMGNVMRMGVGGGGVCVRELLRIAALVPSACARTHAHTQHLGPPSLFVVFAPPIAAPRGWNEASQAGTPQQPLERGAVKGRGLYQSCLDLSFPRPWWSSSCICIVIIVDAWVHSTVTGTVAQATRCKFFLRPLPALTTRVRDPWDPRARSLCARLGSSPKAPPPPPLNGARASAHSHSPSGQKSTALVFPDDPRDRGIPSSQAATPTR